MDGEDNPNNGDGPGDGKRNPSISPVGDTYQKAKLRTHKAYETAKRLSNRLREVSGTLTKSEWLMVWFTAVIALATVANVWVVKKQLGEMQSTGVDTHNLALATDNLAERAKSQADAMDKLRIAGEAQARSMDRLKSAGEAQASATRNLADNSARQLGAIQASATASEHAASAAIAQSDATKAEAESVKGQTVAVQQSLVATENMAAATQKAAAASDRGNDIANRAFLASERPWIGVNGIQVGQLQAGQDLAITVDIENSGRSPALGMHGGFYAKFVTPTTQIPAIPEYIGVSSATVLPSGAWAYSPVVSGTDITAAEIDKVKAGTDLLALFGRIDYRDDTGATHTTLLCSLYNVKFPSFNACHAGNDAN